ncbi:MAG: hypothetical protein KGN02_10235 [bacterium]|nr:hypothetical protein [bacterium]
MRKPFPWKRAGYIALGALAIYVIVGVILAGRDTPPLPPSQTGITLAGGQVRGNRIATKAWSFDYATAQLSADGTTGTVEGVKDGIVYKHGKPHLRISAERVSLDTQALNFTAVGKVHVELIGDPAHRSFDTDLVTWTNGAKLLRMDHPSYVHSDGQTLKIDGVTIDFGTNKVHINKIDGAFVAPSP